MSVRRIGAEERRARLAIRHHLAPSSRAESVVDVANDLVGLHATDPATVYLAAAARMRSGAVDAIERALYDERTLVRMLGMRRTMFVLPVEIAGIVQQACSRAIAVQERRRLVQWLEQAEIANASTWLHELKDLAVQALAVRGEATAAELGAVEPRLRRQLVLAQGKSYETTVSVSTRVLLLLAAQGRIIRGRPRGSWISSQYRWAPVEAWLPGGLGDWSTETARAELVRRWLAAFGPAPVADLRWWTGWTTGDVKRALASIAPLEVDLDGVPGIALPGDLEPVAAPEPWVALLPALDPTVMGWSQRSWFLGDHGPTLFDRNGNAGPTIWSDGRIVGGWAQRRDGQIAYRLLEDVGAQAVVAIEQEAKRLAGWFGPVRATPRFRTPLERELVA
jgi:DNA glycosylase AlkZ-like